MACSEPAELPALSLSKGAWAVNRTPDASLFHKTNLDFSKDWTISSPKIMGVGRLRKFIVGTHLLVSTPSSEIKPAEAWLGIATII